MRTAEPPFVCRGLDDPEVNTVPIEVLIGRELATDFASLPLPEGDVVVRPPGGKTLVNVETRFHTSQGSQSLPPVQILGRGVVVTAVALRYDWFMGDGSSYSGAGPGSEAAPIRHVYRRPGRVGPFVRITWGGTFTVAGVPGSFPVVGTTTTDSAPADVTVRSAGSQLVRR